jgi:hypothetical protein
MVPNCKQLIKDWLTYQDIQVFEGIAYYTWGRGSSEDGYSVFVFEDKDYYTAYTVEEDRVCVYEENSIERIVRNL